MNKVQTIDDMNILNRCKIAILFVFLTSYAFGQSADHTEGCVDLEVKFKSEVTLSSYYWDFKAGVESKQKDPTKTFTVAGTYDVELREGENGRLVKTIQIKVYPKPILELDMDPDNGCAPLEVTFNAGRSVIDGNIKLDSLHWSFGDGSSLDTAKKDFDVKHMYTKDGLYDIGIKIETDKYNCSITTIFEDILKIHEVPTAQFTTRPGVLTVCEPPFTLKFNNTSTGKGTLTYNWDFGDGTSSTDKDPADKIFTKDGRYEMILTVTNEHGCEHEFSRFLNIGNPKIILPLPDTICDQVPFIFTNRSSFGKNTWEFEDAVPPTSTNRNPLVLFNSPGSKTIKLKITSVNGKCSSDTTFTIFVEDPSAEFTSFPSYSCAEPMEVQFTPKNQRALSYYWTFPDSSTSTDKNPKFTMEDSTTTVYTHNGELFFRTELILTTMSGCIDTFIRLDTIFLPNARFMPDVTKGCAPLNVMFSDSSHSKEDIVSWEWDYGDGSTDTKTNGTDHSHVYQNAGEYLVTLIIINAAGCLDTSYQVLIEVGESINLDFTADKTEVCPGDPVTFTSINNDPRIDGWHFHTDKGRSFHCFQDSSVTWTFDDETGDMDVDLEVDYNGCYTTLSKSALVKVKGPIAHLDYLVDCSTPYDISFTDLSNEATTITWDFGDSTTSTEKVLTHKYDTTGDYKVILKAENADSGCPDSYDTVTVFVRDVISRITIDTNACDGVEHELIAGTSQDASTRCFNGYTWLFSKDRPRTTPEDTMQYVFIGKGDWQVSLESTDINGCRDTTTVTVHVYKVEPDFEMSDDRFCVPAEIMFTNKSKAECSDIQSYSWNFGDGGTSSEKDPKHTYTKFIEDTTYVTLTIDDQYGCSDTKFVPFSMYKPVSDITTIPMPPFVCLGEEIEFKARDFREEGSFLTFDWDFGNGETGDLIEHTISYQKEGEYFVQMIGTEDGTGCVDTSNIVVKVQAPPEALFKSSIDPDTVGCANSIIKFTGIQAPSGSSVVYRKWILGNGQIVEGTNAFSVENSFRKGKFDVTFIAESEYRCKDTLTRSFEFIGPEGDFNSNQDTICAGDEIILSISDTVDVDRWVWEINGTEYENIDPITNEIFATDNIDSSNIVLKLYKKHCELVVVRPIHFHRAKADFSLDGQCIGVNRFINGSKGADEFDWTFSDGSKSDMANPFFDFKTAGSHKIELKIVNNKFGCRDSIIKDVNISPNPIANGLDTIYCEGDPIILNPQITNKTDTAYWKSLDGITIDSARIDSLSGKDVFLFELSIKDDKGCIGLDTVEIILIQRLLIPDFDTTICKGDAIILPSEDIYGYYKYTWSDSVSNNNTDVKNPLFEGEVSDSLNLHYVSTPNGCGVRDATFIITVIDGNFKFPLAFSPNGDGENDFFTAIGDKNIVFDEETVLRFDIYNRWGQKVYSNKNPVKGWDGQFNSAKALPEVYIYIFEYQIAGCRYVIKGDVTLLR